ncbi:hypothetical protein GCM10011613_31990 [Cellvibrio zantedeschiae]|uniref:Uncharacterized protein n=1 Tax=Cellvibrio zantedeschiae TaxID=1237077 RepID=A0ABQ3BCS3_9GAMM|nr:hypothetical protein GCM10011613_31990 [Cellvibrio zantedeschiae]
MILGGSLPAAQLKIVKFYEIIFIANDLVLILFGFFAINEFVGFAAIEFGIFTGCCPGLA